MFILGDETKHRGLPWVTLSLVVINVLVFTLQLALGDQFTRGFALVPEEIVSGKDLTRPTAMTLKEAYRDRYPGKNYGKIRYRERVVQIPQATGPFPIHLTLLTSMFLHGGWLHLIGNMWFLLVFGRNVELAMRHGLFLGFYVTCGIVAALAHLLVDPHSVVPCLGASGAISGVMGAYFFIYPLNKIKCWFGFYIGVIELPTFVVVGFWFLCQYLSTFAAITSGQVHGGVAYWSHLGGFVAGIAFVVITLAILKHQARKQDEMKAMIEEWDEETEADKLFTRADGKPWTDPLADPFTDCLPPTPPGPADERIKATADRGAFRV